MRSGKIIQIEKLSHLPDDDSHGDPVIAVLTDLPAGTNNSFYMEECDSNRHKITLGDAATGSQSTDLMTGDYIVFDKQDRLIHKCAVWKGRKIRQRGYSFDGYQTHWR